MSNEPVQPLDYARPKTPSPRYRPVLTWVLFALALLFSFMSIQVHSTNRGMTADSSGATAAGLWIAFALLRVQDRKERVG